MILPYNLEGFFSDVKGPPAQSPSLYKIWSLSLMKFFISSMEIGIAQAVTSPRFQMLQFDLPMKIRIIFFQLLPYQLIAQSVRCFPTDWIGFLLGHPMLLNTGMVSPLTPIILVTRIDCTCVVNVGTGSMSILQSKCWCVSDALMTSTTSSIGVSNILTHTERVKLVAVRTLYWLSHL